MFLAILIVTSARLEPIKGIMVTVKNVKTIVQLAMVILVKNVMTATIAKMEIVWLVLETV